MAFRPVGSSLCEGDVDWSRAEGNGAPDFTEARVSSAGGLVAVARSWHHKVDAEQEALALLVTLETNRSADPATFELPPVKSIGTVEIEVRNDGREHLAAWSDGIGVAAVGEVLGVPAGVAWLRVDDVPGLAQVTPRLEP